EDVVGVRAELRHDHRLDAHPRRAYSVYEASTGRRDCVFGVASSGAAEPGGGLPRTLLHLQAAPLLRHVEMRREPDVGERLDVPDQLVEHRDARVAADAEGMDDEEEAPAGGVRAVVLRLPDLEHLRRRREA